MGTELQYRDWLSCRCNDVIHSKQWLYFYKSHSTRHVPGKDGNKTSYKTAQTAFCTVRIMISDTLLCCICWLWHFAGTTSGYRVWCVCLDCHLLLKTISTETLRRGSAESTDSSWIQEEDIWAMLAESTINYKNTKPEAFSHSNTLCIFQIYFQKWQDRCRQYVYKEHTITEEQSLK